MLADSGDKFFLRIVDRNKQDKARIIRRGKSEKGRDIVIFRIDPIDDLLCCSRFARFGIAHDVGALGSAPFFRHKFHCPDDGSANRRDKNLLGGAIVSIVDEDFFVPSLLMISDEMGLHVKAPIGENRIGADHLHAIDENIVANRQENRAWEETIRACHWDGACREWEKSDAFGRKIDCVFCPNPKISVERFPIPLIAHRLNEAMNERAPCRYWTIFAWRAPY